MNYLQKYPVLGKNAQMVGYDFINKDQDDIELVDYYSILDNIISLSEEDYISMLEIDENLLIKNIDILKLFSKDSILKIKKGMKFSDTLAKKVRYLSESGYKLAIYYEPSSNYELNEYIKYINYVMVDVDSYETNTQSLKRLNKKIILTDVMTTEIFDRYKDEGIEKFVGEFEYVQKKRVESYKRKNDKVIILNILSELENNSDTNRIAQVFARNTDITIKLLQYINSPAIGLRSEVSSIQQAIALLGRAPLMAWLGMFLYGSDSTKFSSLVKIKIKNRIATIALFLKCMAKEQYSEKGLLVASLSLAEIVVDRPLEELIRSMRLDEEIEEAILDKEGILGAGLKLAICFEKKKYTEVDELFDKYFISDFYKNEFYKIHNLPVEPQNEEPLFHQVVKKFKLFGGNNAHKIW